MYDESATLVAEGVVCQYKLLEVQPDKLACHQCSAPSIQTPIPDHPVFDLLETNMAALWVESMMKSCQKGQSPGQRFDPTSFTYRMVKDHRMEIRQCEIGDIDRFIQSYLMEGEEA